VTRLFSAANQVRIRKLTPEMVRTMSAWDEGVAVREIQRFQARQRHNRRWSLSSLAQDLGAPAMTVGHFVARFCGATRFRWYRRLCGGVWEHWWIDSPFNCFVWVELDVPSDELGKRPVLARGTPVIEDYRRRALDVPDRLLD
jgi:hypothetical protein